MSEHRRAERGLFGQAIVSTGDQELVRTVRLALRAARRHLADHAHVKAPKKFTQPQLLACLILKAITGATYRRTEEMLILMPAVREALGLRDVPRFTTLQAFADRPDVLALIDAVLRTLGRAAMKHQRQDAALDGTGVETTSASAHFVSRAGRKRTKFVKLMLGVLCASVMPAALVVDWGPSHDLRQAWAARDKLLGACGRDRPTMRWGDGAFDSEAWHASNWDDHRTPSDAPVTVRSKDGRVHGRHRAVFAEMSPRAYGRRWMCESVNSAIKRMTGSTLRSRKQNTMFAEAAFKVLAYAAKV
ncbi:MAG: transposase [Phycisphaerales bacterium]|nr:transposase [Phycisphaerales bacterium]